MDGQGFPHDIFSKTLGPPKYPKIKFEVKKRCPREHLAENITFLKQLLNRLLMDKAFVMIFSSHLVVPPKCPPKCPKIKFEVKNGM